MYEYHLIKVRIIKEKLISSNCLEITSTIITVQLTFYEDVNDGVYMDL